jgi:hypothetical protein
VPDLDALDGRVGVFCNNNLCVSLSRKAIRLVWHKGTRLSAHLLFDKLFN